MQCRYTASCGRTSNANGRPVRVISATRGSGFRASACAAWASPPRLSTRSSPVSVNRSQCERKNVDLGLAGSAAVVTGGSKGMGLAIAQTLAAEGASVAVMARGKAALDAAVESLRDAGAPDAVGISVDMTDAASILSGFDEVADRWGRLNSLVHTIGPGDGYFEQMDDAEWDAAFTLGTMAGVRSVRAALPMLRAADWARIVTLSAHSIQRQNPRIVAYTASKAALSSVTK